MNSPVHADINSQVQVQTLQYESTKVGPWGYSGRRGGHVTQRAGPPRGAVVMETRRSQPLTTTPSGPRGFPFGKMVARRRKRAARDPQEGIPSPPGYSGEGLAGPGTARVRGEAAPGSAVAPEGRAAPGLPRPTRPSPLAALSRDEPTLASLG